MKTNSRLRFAFLLLAGSFIYTSGLGAETLQVGSTGEYQDVCSAIAEAMPGDTIEILNSGKSIHCVWTTSNLTIKGIGSRPVVTGDPGAPVWSVAADGTVIENIAFEGSRCTAGACAAVELLSGNLTLRDVSIKGSDIGVRAANSDSSSLTMERCEIYANASNVRVGKISLFTLLSSYVHNAFGGPVVETAAAKNIIRSNRLELGSEPSAFGELTITGSGSTELIGNVLARVKASSTAGLVQFIHQNGEPGQVFAEQNTLVSAATSGIEFIESIGDRSPLLTLERNVFWGDSPVGAIAHAASASRNYFGIEKIFRGDANFKLEGDYVPADWGAVAADEAGFPLSMAPAAKASVEPKSFRTKSAITGVSPASIILNSTVVGGAAYLFNNPIVLTGPAPVGGVNVTITTSNAAVVKVITPSVQIPAGATTGKFSLQTFATTSPTQVTIGASANGGVAEATLSVGAVSVSGITIGATEVGSNATVSTNRVDLTGPAPAGGLVVALSSSSTAVIAPQSVTVPAGMVSMNFALNAGLVNEPTTATITATVSTVSKAGTLTVIPVGLTSVYISPVSTSGGQTILVKTYLNGPAPVGGLPVTIINTKPALLPVPGVITVPEGATEAGILTTLDWVTANTGITLNGASAYATAKGSMTAIPTQMSALGASLKKISSLGTTTLLLTLTGPAPTGGITINLSSTVPEALSCPESVFVAAGQRTLSVVATAGTVAATTTATIRAVASNGGATKSLGISIVP